MNRYKSRLLTMVRHPLFAALTLGGNLIIVIGGVLLYYFEAAVQTPAMTFLDSLLWSTGTVTTIGYAEYAPQTLGGKISYLFLMLVGTLFVWSYMAFLVTGLIAPELASLEKDMQDIEREIHSLRKG